MHPLSTASGAAKSLDLSTGRERFLFSYVNTREIPTAQGHSRAPMNGMPITPVTRRIVPPHPNSPSSPLTGCPPPTCVTVACRPPAIAPIHRRAPACLPSSLAPFVATHPPPVTNRLSDFDSSRRVEPWRVGECSLTCEGRFFVVMHRTAIVLPQPMGVVQIERPFLQVIDS